MYYIVWIIGNKVTEMIKTMNLVDNISSVRPSLRTSLLSSVWLENNWFESKESSELLKEKSAHLRVLPIRTNKNSIKFELCKFKYVSLMLCQVRTKLH